MDSYQQSEPGQFPLKDGDANGNALSSTAPLKDQPKPSKTSPSLRYEDFTPTIVTDGREVRLEVCRLQLFLLLYHMYLCDTYDERYRCPLQLQALMIFIHW